MDVVSPFERLGPVSDAYADLPVGQAFTWDAVTDSVPSGEWYMVAFRSVRASDADEALLTWYDDRAHAEAASASGFVHYFKGPIGNGGRCMSFCLWTSRSDARAAARQPLHAAAAGIVREMYASYRLEFHRVTKSDGGPFTFEPYDAASGAHTEPAGTSA
jgi:heme-degrading monooxygenase HmoA